MAAHYGAGRRQFHAPCSSVPCHHDAPTRAGFNIQDDARGSGTASPTARIRAGLAQEDVIPARQYHLDRAAVHPLRPVAAVVSTATGTRRLRETGGECRGETVPQRDL